ncbi:S-formylglutathione hydrolase [Neosynechococcus sphagnicola sy1]|uniref:S-formylglutathione hydrolase n=1 Tax=Neosynechococcus sphagnicola sy1 TaxID=1497020 RepID=A0A098TL85_9CYAN|nr:S-formylglutathione hydrolase [Neosynechococcus sphagnicola]KGF72627.1 S-formylglutathione hydrolase [Neosynechococcus sphagnicola sy1]
MTILPTCTSQSRCFDGTIGFYRHFSDVCRTEMRFSVYLPPQATGATLPIVYWLSGLTCTEENFMIKAGAQQFAAQYGLILVAPDTSPRNLGLPGETETWDFGAGAGFYVDATTDPWNAHYRMYTYVTEELPALMAAFFPGDRQRQGIMGHSMGGHGALICALRNPDRYRSVSAFAPIAAPMGCAWGQKAFRGYLGTDSTAWQAYDASQIVIHSAWNQPILIDQGTADPFLPQGQLLPEVFEQACAQAGKELILRRQEGYDHSYSFIATFIADHLRHHAMALR